MADPTPTTSDASAANSAGPVIQIDRILETVIKNECSDLHLSVGKRPTVRAGHGLVELNKGGRQLPLGFHVRTRHQL